MSSTNLIYSHVYDPRESNLFIKSKPSDTATHYTVECDHAHQCAVYAAGQCLAIGAFSACLRGKKQEENGPTKRSTSTLPRWVAERRAIKPVDDRRLTLAPRKLAVVAGDTVWLPYSHMDDIRASDKKIFRHWTESFLPLSEFTADLIVKLAEAVPRNAYYEPIPSYQREEVPKFIMHAAELFPELVAEAATKSQRVRDILGTMSKVGRKAYICTIKPNVGALATRKGEPAVWVWNGTTLTTSTRSGIPAFTPFDAVEVTVTPGPTATAIITSDDQVGPDTKFAD